MIEQTHCGNVSKLRKSTMVEIIWSNVVCDFSFNYTRVKAHWEKELEFVQHDRVNDFSFNGS